jgi:hypothetical protein
VIDTRSVPGLEKPGNVPGESVSRNAVLAIARLELESQRPHALADGSVIGAGRLSSPGPEIDPGAGSQGAFAGSTLRPGVVTNPYFQFFGDPWVGGGSRGTEAVDKFGLGEEGEEIAAVKTCGAMHPGGDFRCTRAPGHAGDHYNKYAQPRLWKGPGPGWWWRFWYWQWEEEDPSSVK